MSYIHINWSCPQCECGSLYLKSRRDRRFKTQLLYRCTTCDYKEWRKEAEEEVINGS